MDKRKLLLGVNIDHVATLRQARFATLPDSPNAEPSVVEAAAEAEAGGADSITVHLRADRRHIQDRDVVDLHQSIGTKLNFELGNIPEIVEIALRLKPDFVCLVPETREEITTEGGLHVVGGGGGAELRQTTARFRDAGVRVSYFIDADPAQVEAAADAGADMIELHTGPFANAEAGDARDAEVGKLTASAVRGHDLGLQVNAGHGINTANLSDLFAVPHLAELNIGHHLVSRALRIGLRRAVAEMAAAMAAYRSPVVA